MKVLIASALFLSLPALAQTTTGPRAASPAWVPSGAAAKGGTVTEAVKPEQPALRILTEAGLGIAGAATGAVVGGGALGGLSYLATGGSQLAAPLTLGAAAVGAGIGYGVGLVGGVWEGGRLFNAGGDASWAALGMLSGVAVDVVLAYGLAWAVPAQVAASTAANSVFLGVGAAVPVAGAVLFYEWSRSAQLSAPPKRAGGSFRVIPTFAFSREYALAGLGGRF